MVKVPVINSDGSQIHWIDIKDINNVQRQKNDIVVHTSNGTFYQITALDDWILLLGSTFIRIDSGILVRKDAIKEFDSKLQVVLLNDGSMLSVARQRIPLVKKAIEETKC
ncbi:LytTR family transcriptional regulator [Brevibacillus brevis X23]|nr:LytTR family transcriptional regulator [Brevibacillus brevis X23]